MQPKNILKNILLILFSIYFSNIYSYTSLTVTPDITMNLDVTEINSETGFNDNIKSNRNDIIIDIDADADIEWELYAKQKDIAWDYNMEIGLLRVTNGSNHLGSSILRGGAHTEIYIRSGSETLLFSGKGSCNNIELMLIIKNVNEGINPDWYQSVLSFIIKEKEF